MENSSQLIEEDINSNSRISLERSLSREGSFRGSGKKMIPNMVNQRNGGVFAISPPDALHGGNMLEKPVVVDLGTTDESIFPQVHHQTTINNGSERRRGRFNLSRSPRTWSINPRSILIFCATLSCIGSIIVIYFTLSIGKFNRNDNNPFFSNLNFHFH
ncbi:hypothetical protein CDL12_13616 [Handroanthus impetiginosus]|uniref:Uncharacterized protein n=1 Tax=Handroanthus impetiginosus TaxID=429701 RepID=A0A2G9H8E4_9LAMI|nr:hypothetical protein CDL12_13616 [Handroanthus impetiginosus]